MSGSGDDRAFLATKQQLQGGNKDESLTDSEPVDLDTMGSEGEVAGGRDSTEPQALKHGAISATPVSLDGVCGDTDGMYSACIGWRVRRYR